MPDDFGLIAMLGVFMGIGNTLINSGLTSSLIRTFNPDNEDFSTVFYFNLMGSFLIYSIIYFFAPHISLFYKQPTLTAVIRQYSVIFVINAFGAVQLARLNKMMDFKTQMKVSVPSTILSGITGISLAALGYGVWSLVYSKIVQSLASTIQLWFWSKWRPLLVFNKDKFNNHFKYGVKLMASGLLDTIFTNLYVIIIGKYFSTAQVGYYNRANNLKMLPVSNVSSIINKVSFPLFAEIQNDDARIKSVYKKIMQMVIYLIAPILILMAVMAEPLINSIFTEKWLPAVPYFQILCVGGILYPIHNYNLQILKVKGRSDLFLKLEILKKVFVVVVVVISFRFGIYGLLYGGVISSILSLFINTYYSGKFINYSAWEQTKDLLPYVALSTIMGMIVFVFDFICKEYFKWDIIRLVSGGMLGTGIYLLLSHVLKLNSYNELKIMIARR